MGDMTTDVQGPASDPVDLTREVGLNVRSQRTAAGLSIAELARRAGVSGPFISQLEAGRSSLSIPTLYRIADALGLSPNGLLPALREDLVTRAGHGPVLQATTTEHPQEPRLLTRRGADVALEGFHYRIDPSHDAQHWYQHRGEDLVYVIAGCIAVEFADGREVELGAGDSLHHDGEVSHRWRLVGEQAAEALIVLTVPPGTPGEVGTAEPPHAPLA
jgi:transcriptional regulator with XRE-family HTH domain